MTMLPLTVDDFVQLAANGGGFEIDASRFSRQDIVRIVANARASGARIVVTSARHLPIDGLIQIASNAKGLVVFEAD